MGHSKLPELNGINGLPSKLDNTIPRLVKLGILQESEAPSIRLQGRRFVKAYSTSDDWRNHPKLRINLANKRAQASIKKSIEKEKKANLISAAPYFLTAMLTAAKRLERDGDEYGVAADLRAAIAKANIGVQ